MPTSATIVGNDFSPPVVSVCVDGLFVGGVCVCGISMVERVLGFIFGQKGMWVRLGVYTFFWVIGWLYNTSCVPK